MAFFWNGQYWFTGTCLVCGKKLQLTLNNTKIGCIVYRKEGIDLMCLPCFQAAYVDKFSNKSATDLRQNSR
ncbi:hypothetical protein ES703_92935 [subsurface metagenome]